MRFYIADAFTDELFGGNPAGVVLIPEGQDYPSEERMRLTAAELRYSETAFIKKLNGTSGYQPEFHVRYFTPEAEVDLCGHATIASFYCLAKSGLLPSSEGLETQAIAHTLAGDISINISFDEGGEPDFIMMDMAEPRHLATINDAIELDRLYEIMGSEFDQSIGLARFCPEPLDLRVSRFYSVIKVVVFLLCLVQKVGSRVDNSIPYAYLRLCLGYLSLLL